MHLLVGQLTQAAGHPAAAVSRPLLWAGLKWRCPRCGEGRLFASSLSIAAQCEDCGLDLSRHEKGDGPAFFVIVVLGALICLLAAAVELLYQPSYWVHAALWLPMTVLGGLLGLKVAKAWMVAMQFKYQNEDFVNE